MMKKLWNDDAGFIISVEWLLVFTIVLLGLIVGLTAVRNAVDSELVESANAISVLDQTYSFSGVRLVSAFSTFHNGSAGNDIPETVTAVQYNPVAQNIDSNLIP